MERTNDAPLRNDGASGRGRRVLTGLLLALALATTGMAGFLVGRSATGPLGQAADTVLLDPQQAAARTTVHLAGQVVDDGGSPAAGLDLELHSDPIAATTDDRGAFLLPGVPFGDHRLTVFAADGSVAAEQAVAISRSEGEQGVSIAGKRDGGCAIVVALDVRMLEVTVRLGEDGLNVLSTGCSYATADGRVVTPAGSAFVGDGAIVTPKGHVCLPDGVIVIPQSDGRAAAAILSDDTVVYLDGGMEGSGYVVEADGTVVFPDGVTIRPGGRILTPDGAEHGCGEGGVVLSGGNAVTPIGGGSSESASPSPIPLPSGGAPSSDAPSSNGGGSASAGSDGPPAGGDASSDERHDPPAGGDDDDPLPDGSFSVRGRDRDGALAPWTQGGAIDLFYNRSAGAREKIAPGSSGYYRFQLQNTLSSALSVRVVLSEEDVRLPLALTLTPVDADGRQTGRAVSGTLSNGSLVLETAVAGKAVAGYRLDWTWPVEGNDTLDTAAGSGESLAYLLSMTIRAEQA